MKFDLCHNYFLFYPHPNLNHGKIINLKSSDLYNWSKGYIRRRERRQMKVRVRGRWEDEEEES